MLIYQLRPIKEFRFNPKQVLGYVHCSSYENRKTLYQFSQQYPCNFPNLPKRDVVIVTFVNSGWINMTKNWICSAKKVGLLDNLFLITVQPGVCSQFPHVACHSEENLTLAATAFGEANYQKFMIERTKVILRLLSCDVKRILLADADIVFVKNPLATLDKEISDKDIVFQRDSTGVKFIDSIAYKVFDYICAGIVYMKINNETKLLYQSVLQFQNHQSWNDQAGLNVCIRHYSLNIKWGLLPVSLFPNGKVFFEFSTDPSKVVIVHTNFLKGSMEKIANMIIHNIWCYVEIVPLLCKDFVKNGCFTEKPHNWCKKLMEICFNR